MNPKQFLQLGGVILVLVAVLGFMGVIGPTPDQSLFGSSWWFDNGENWAHLIFGAIALAASYWLQDEAKQKQFSILVGILALFVGVIGFFLSSTAPNFLGANLENPADNILHLAVGVWALWAAKTRQMGS